MNNLEGKWVKVLEARHYGDGIEFTPADLDSVVRNYKNREEDAPVGVGHNWSGAAKLASIKDLRRSGDNVEAQLTGVAPQLNDFYGETGSFPRVAVAVKKRTASGGPSIQRVGFLRADGTFPRVEKTVPRVDHLGNNEIVFAENSPASRAIQKLKARGYWFPVFDEYCFSEIFDALQSSDTLIEFDEGNQRRSLPAIAAFSRFIQSISPMVLHSTAQKIQRAKGISYGEALTLANNQPLGIARNLQLDEMRRGGARGVELHHEAQRVADDRGVSYGEALAQVVRERPDLAAG